MSRRVAALAFAAFAALPVVLAPARAEASGLGQLRPGTPIDLHLDLNAGPFPRHEVRLGHVLGFTLAPSFDSVVGVMVDGDVRPFDHVPNLALGAYLEADAIGTGAREDDTLRGYQLRGGVTSRLSVPSGLAWASLGAGPYVLHTHDRALVRREDDPFGIELALALGGMLPSKRFGFGLELEGRGGLDVAGSSDLGLGPRASVVLKLLVPSIGFGEVEAPRRFSSTVPTSRP